MLLFWRRFTKFLLLFLNFLIMVLGCGVTTVGVTIQFQTELMDGYLTPLVQIIPSGGGTGQNVYSLYYSISIALIAFGGIMFIVGLTGCVIGTCSSRTSLLTYAVLMTILLLTQVTCVALLGTTKVGNKLLESLLSNFVIYYKGDEATDQYSDAWNYIMTEFGCCAVRDYTDFSICNWDRQKLVDNVTFMVQVPVTCCKLPGVYPTMGEPLDSNCTMDPNEENSYIHDGCYDEVEDYIDHFRILMMVTLGIAIATEIASSMAALVLENAKKQAKRKRVGPDTAHTSREKLK